ETKEEIQVIDKKLEKIEEEIELTADELNEVEEEESEAEEFTVEETEAIKSSQIIDEEKPTKKGFFNKLISGLTKTRKEMTDKIDGILSMYKKIDEELFEDLEEVLVTADVGVNTTMELIDRLRDRVKSDKVTDPSKVKELLK